MITSDNIAQANEIMLQLISELQRTKPLPFGCDLAHADPHVVVHSTVCSRLFKKFERPDTSRTDELKDQCESKWIALREMFVLHTRLILRWCLPFGILFTTSALLYVKCYKAIRAHLRVSYVT